jgi:class 3 adenylate cyclase
LKTPRSAVKLAQVPPIEPPTGSVTMLFTDIEGSTRRARALGGRWPAVLGTHHELVERAIGRAIARASCRRRAARSDSLAQAGKLTGS